MFYYLFYEILFKRYAGQLPVGIVVCLLLFKTTDYSSVLYVPFLKYLRPNLTIWGYSAFVTFVLMATSNTVNLTDGLDGLAISVTVVAASALTGLTYITG